MSRMDARLTRLPRRLARAAALIVLLALSSGVTLRVYAPSLALAAFGNASLEPGESCDDGNTANGDGSSALCRVESSDPYRCSRARTAAGAAPSVPRRVALSEVFEMQDVIVRKVEGYGVPVETDNEGSHDPGPGSSATRLRVGPVRGPIRAIWT